MAFSTDTSMSDVITLLFWRNLANPKLRLGHTIIQFERLSLDSYRAESKLKPVIPEYRLLPMGAYTSIVLSVILLHYNWFSKIAKNIYAPNYPDTSISLTHMVKVIVNNTNPDLLNIQANIILEKGFLK